MTSLCPFWSHADSGDTRYVIHRRRFRSDAQDVGLRHTFHKPPKICWPSIGENVWATGQLSHHAWRLTATRSKPRFSVHGSVVPSSVKITKDVDESAQFHCCHVSTSTRVIIYLIFSFITNIYKDNYDSLSINEQLSYIGARNAEACIKSVVLCFVAGFSHWPTQDRIRCKSSLQITGTVQHDRPVKKILHRMQTKMQCLWCLSWWNSALFLCQSEVDITKSMQKETGVLKRLQLRWTVFL